MWSAAMDVGVWLRSLDLGQYGEEFRDKIDADVLGGRSAQAGRGITALLGTTPPANAPATLLKV
jgi:hypothetical protein